ncbi:hypothetical protein WK59_03965 [Burkholderia ubonensis]|uniref:hypothetical protein n=1 Tax=Burkholderia ubonensis TaxID=101571 RepID=UPI00075CC742|nr:hypothetical protein [Burkholderia ubonensis]KVT91900.1 hypothetical protein WK59_03965 [Burkholderia ubonensis]
MQKKINNMIRSAYDWKVSFVAGAYIESLTIDGSLAATEAHAQERAIETWEELGVVHGELTVVPVRRALPLLPH